MGYVLKAVLSSAQHPEYGQIMTMQDWSQRLNRFLEFNEHEILHDTGRVTHEIAKAFAESEFEKYRIVQDRMFESDFDHFLALEEQAERKND